MSQQHTQALPQAESAAGVAPSTRFRPEVQGLRALAVLMVVTYHIWFNRVSGGVDIFLLISAFLLSLSFMRKVEAGRPLELGRHWLHRFKRLLPAVVVVLLGTLAATALVVPRTRWDGILDQTWSSLLYYQNWALAELSVDYYASDNSVASPLQHFWSLSVQGQVFILWPLLFAAAALLARYGRLPFRRVVLLLFGSVFLVSLSYSVAETYSNQSYAYFDTRTRLWEFAFGTLLALALPYLRLPRGVRVAAGWLGLAAMLSCGFLIDVQGAFPGFVALWPLTAAALIIAAGQTGSRFGADRLLTWRPLIRLGDISYALYLWHWPILVIYLIWRGRSEVGLVGGAGIITLSLVLAWLTTKLIENPLRSNQWLESSWRRSALVIAACCALVAGPAGLWQEGLRLQAERLAADAERNNPGAAVLLPGYEDRSDPDAAILPLADQVDGEWAQFPSDCRDAEKQEVSCELHTGAPGAPRIIVVGSSHAEAWVTALEEIAEERDWTLSVLLKAGCPLSLEETVGSECREYASRTLGHLLSTRPDLVVTTSSRTVLDGDEYVDASWAASISRLLDAGIRVAAIRDTPRLPVNAPDCLAVHSEPEACGVAEDRTLGAVNPAETIISGPGITHIDFSPYFCFEGYCPPVIGNVLVYIDHNHITSTYVKSMVPILAERLDESLGSAGADRGGQAEVPGQE
ncbi:O-acetyltransferase OatA [Arthrobacter saudimassiliensis]|uniref:O-acetyltransferase OatA n=1 Tax=Arthrobacter saudimassiliensis TaxID=1461584 RepID=A0A078MN39_9MICC|nr:O-acetyltransferase OatA [Arthrobacter saudimassiliensis]